MGEIFVIRPWEIDIQLYKLQIGLRVNGGRMERRSDERNGEKLSEECRGRKRECEQVVHGVDKKRSADEVHEESDSASIREASGGEEQGRVRNIPEEYFQRKDPWWLQECAPVQWAQRVGGDPEVPCAEWVGGTEPEEDPMGVEADQLISRVQPYSDSDSQSPLTLPRRVFHLLCGSQDGRHHYLFDARPPCYSSPLVFHQQFSRLRQVFIALLWPCSR